MVMECAQAENEAFSINEFDLKKMAIAGRALNKHVFINDIAQTF